MNLVENAAGVLISSLGNADGAADSVEEAAEPKTAPDVTPMKDQQSTTRGATLPREKTLTIESPSSATTALEGQLAPTPTDSSSQTKTNNHNATSSLFR